MEPEPALTARSAKTRPLSLQDLRTAASLWLPFLGLYAAGFWLRFTIASTAPYTAEAAHYVVARQLWDPIPTFPSVYEENGGGITWLFWQRPAFSLLLWPGAALSFEAYRLLHVAASSLLPVLAYLLLRGSGVRLAFALPACAVLALHPRFFPWGTLVLPDALMTVLVLASALAFQRGRAVASAGLMLLAIWTKEVAAVGLAALFLLGFLQERATHDARLWPLRLGPATSPFMFALLAAFVPLLFSLAQGGRFPGWGVGGDPMVVLEKMWLLAWFLPAAFLGLLFPRIRLIGALSAAFTAFFLVYHFVLGRTIEIWYYVAPAALTVLALAALLDEAFRARPALRHRALVAAGAVLVGALVALPLALPAESAANQAVATPFTRSGERNIPQAIDLERGRDQDLLRVLSAMPARVEGLLAVDLDWSYLYYPLDPRADRVYQQYTAAAQYFQQEIGPWASTIESRANFTLVFVNEEPLNKAVRQVYQDCRVAQDGRYELFEGPRCAGRADALRAEYERQRPVS